MLYSDSEMNATFSLNGGSIEPVINPPPMSLFAWDDIPHFTPAWPEIAGKAAMYKTAYRRSDGKILALLGVSRYADGCELAEPVFMVRDELGMARMSTDQLCSFCL